MRLIARFLPVLAVLSLCAFSAPAISADAAAVHQQREAFAREFAQIVLSIIQDPKKSYGDRKDVLRQAFGNSVDIDWIARFVLGKSWRDASEAQRIRYTALYRAYLTESYVANFAENPDKRISDITIFGVNDATDDNFTVRTRMRLADRENVQVNYLVHDDNGTYKVLDIAIENVSLIATHRAEFTALAGARGVDGVIGKLDELLHHPKSEMTLSMR